jgi:hypothetical protein
MTHTERSIHRREQAALPNSAERSPVPLETEPAHFPMSALAPAPRRAVAPIPSVEQEWPWLRYVYVLGFLLAILLSALADHLT